MLISVRLFAMLRELAGGSQLELDLPEGARVADLQAALPATFAGLPLIVAVNREYATPDIVLRSSDEVALIPPVSGGAEGRVHVAIGSEPLDLGGVLERVRDPAAGAEVLFVGVTRSVERLDYEAYAEMAQQLMREIAEHALREHGLCAVAIEHRIGAVPLSEASVAVAASAPHRPEAFAGARMVIDEVKERVPIWKRESDGPETRWVEGTLPSA